MSLSDFASLVQLGIGLHAGAVFLQLAAEFISAPLVRKLRSLEATVSPKSELIPHVYDHVRDLLTDLEVRQGLFADSQLKLTLINGFVALALIVLLIWISFDGKREVGFSCGVAITVLSVAPVIVTVGWYGLDWWRKTKSIRSGIADVEKRVRESNRRS